MSSCTKPIKAFVCGTKENGKKNILFTKDLVKRLEYERKGFEEIEIPCGQCIGCRLQYSRQWADRCLMELDDCEDACFITLTYEDPPRTEYKDENGVTHDGYTLRKKDLQDFFKRLRSYYPDCKLRYFACGEYGSSTQRPHYHAIVYGLKLDDLRYYKRSDLSHVYYNSDRLDRCWNKGFVVVGNVSWQSCAYVARYVVKKAKGKTADSYKKFNMETEFVVMSRKPGIGKKYFEKMKEELYEFGEVYLSDENGSIKCKPSRYFDKLMETENNELLEKVKIKRKQIAEDLQDAKLSLTDLNIDELREVEEYDILQRTKALRREL